MPDNESPDGIKNPVDFAEVLEKELRQIDARRRHLHQADDPRPPSGDGTPPNQPDKSDRLERAEQGARERRLVGLSFSGGGIRSATFNLGVLQALAGMGLLKVVDYLSTVSGGGYIGSWLTAWIKRQKGGVLSVEKQLATNRDAGGTHDRENVEASDPIGSTARSEPLPILHLRQYSNYLAPRTGFLSSDTSVLAAIYLRNFLLGQLVILPSVLIILLISRLTMLLYHPIENIDDLKKGCFLGMGILTAVPFLVAFIFLMRAALHVRERDSLPVTDANDKRLRPWGINAITLLLLLSAILFCWFAPYWLPIPRARTVDDVMGVAWDIHWPRLVLFIVICSLLVIVGISAAVISLNRAERPDSGKVWLSLFWAIPNGILGGSLLYGTYVLLNSLYQSNGIGARDYIKVRATAELTTLGPPLVLGAMFLAFSIGVGVLKNRISEARREWWASLCGRLLAIALIWLTINLVALYGTALVLRLGPFVQSALVSGWLLTVAAGVKGGGSQKTPSSTAKSTSSLDLLVRLTPHIFLIGLLIGVSLLIHVTLDNPPNWKNASDAVWVREVEPDRPLTRVTESEVQTRDKMGKLIKERERRDVVERLEVLDDADIVQQMYWVGMLNTKADHIPSVSYLLTPRREKRLEACGVPCPVLCAFPDSLRKKPGEKGVDRETFIKALDETLPPETSYRYRFKIIQYCKKVESLEFKRSQRAATLLGALGGCFLFLVFFAWRVDVNLFSLHALYGNRLVRAYLGASRKKRSGDPITRLDPNDDLRLACLLGNEDPTQPAHYDGPYPLINTALNLVHGSRLDWQERKAESFVMTPLYCGSENTGYRRTANWDPSQPPEDLEKTPDAYAGNVQLGTAVTLSGAAASPNMGYHSSPFVTALLTVFNARLGGWLGNPGSKDERWKKSGPTFGFWYLFREMFGITHTHGGFVYLSDGGHFENLGVYELVRRRCQYVIVSDAGQDGAHAFEDLGNLIRKCRADFGIRIEIKLDSLRLNEDGFCRWHCAIGRIRYDDVDPRAIPGTLIYIKPCLTGDEPADVRNYSKSNPSFPHESTGDQFFSESQFESYRELGEHVAESVFKLSLRETEEMLKQQPPAYHGATNPTTPVPFAVDKGEKHRRYCRELFSSMVRRWFSMPPEYEAAFLESSAGYISIHQALRSEPRLRRLDRAIYPEIVKPGDETTTPTTEVELSEIRGAELNVIAQMFQVMENAWLSLNLAVHYAHPLNRGWLSSFHRWITPQLVRDYWPMLRGEFGRDFVSFCERQMRLGVVKGRVMPFLEGGVPEVLSHEFRDQWPAEPGIDERLAKVCKVTLQEGERRLAWLIYPTAPASEELATCVPGGRPVPCGIIFLSPSSVVQEGKPPIYELFVWIRGAYRNTGLGRPALRQVLDEMIWLPTSLLARPFRLQVRLPIKDMPGPGGKLQRSMWLTFYHHFEFVRVESIQDATSQKKSLEEEEIILERDFLG